jgi:hypothetical protein
MNGIKALELLMEKMSPGMGYKKCMELIQEIISEIKETELSKLLALGEKFDIDHMNYDKLVERGHVKSTTEYHEYLSEFSLENMNSMEVFDKMDVEHKKQILVDVVSDKEITEQLVAHRFDFDYITHTKGHDGIHPENGVYEVKNLKYTKPKNDNRFSMSIKFDRLSENTLRKLDEGRPTIVVNSTDKHKLLIEMNLEFTDEMIEIYKSKLAGVKGKDTSGTSISFSDFQHAIKNVTYISDDFSDYNFSLDLLKYLNDNHGTTYDIQRKSTLCPKIQKILTKETENIKNLFTLGTPMAKIARDISTKSVTISGTHVKKVLTAGE